MAESPHSNTLTWVRSEPELRALAQWLDNEYPRMNAGREWGLWGGITGVSFGLGGGMIGILAGAMQMAPSHHPWVVAGPLVAAATVSALAGLIIARQRRQRFEAEQRREFADAGKTTWQLVVARWQGSIKATFGADRALALNEGASHVLRCHASLRSGPWKSVGEGSEYARVREKVGNAIDLSMARLVSVIGRGTDAHEVEVRQLLADMKSLADEAVATAERLAQQKGATSAGPDELRQALSELRLLNEAHEEVVRLQARD